MRTPRLICLAACLSAQASAAVITSSSFASSAEGWTALTGDSFQADFPVTAAATLAFNAGAGNPAGSVSVLDPDNFDTMFSAPAAYLGNQSAALGGNLRYDVRGDRTGDYDGADVVIKGGGIVLIYDVPSMIGTSWQTFVVPLAPGTGWTVGTMGGSLATSADFQAALSSVTELYIGAEFFFGTVETASLDNVSLNEPDPFAVPEPPTVLFIGTGLTMLAIGRRRARKK